MEDLEAFDFDNDPVLRHVHRICFDRVPDILVGSDGDNELEGLQFLSSDFFDEVSYAVEAIDVV